MKVLRRVCPRCAHVALFSVEVLCRPGADEHAGEFCPFCRSTSSPAVFFADELDITEVDPEPVDVEAIREAIAAAYAKSQ